jgi:hypothetical protein
MAYGFITVRHSSSKLIESCQPVVEPEKFAYLTGIAASPDPKTN